MLPDAVQTPMLDLQVDFKEAALTISGARALTVQDIENVAVDEVLPNKPLEVAAFQSHSGGAVGGLDAGRGEPGAADADPQGNQKRTSS